MDIKKITIVVVIALAGQIGFLVGKSVGTTETTAAAAVVSIEKSTPWYTPWADDEYTVVRANGTSDKIIIK
ncbi:MAG: hypothetical protein EBU84_00445 [Actinobacteria bacterium]|nr:hypothetical protein [Actinomycetota bacterium]